MYVKSLDLQNFRNYESLSLAFEKGTTIFYGGNAQGKTNILEALFLAGTTKSHRSVKDRDLIRIGQEESHIRMHVDRGGNDFRIDMHLKKSRPKGIAIDGVPIKRAAELFGIVHFVFFSPEDLNIIKNGPSERRRFMDLLLCSIDPIYLSDLTMYSRCLNQRNRLLHDLIFNPSLEGELDIWDMQLSSYGRRVIEKRESFVKDLCEIAREVHGTLTGGAEALDIRYEPNTPADRLEEKLFASRETDKKMKTSSQGPHRDDICIRVGGMDLRVFGSQGQQRTAALSLKMSEIRMMEMVLRDKPVLLLDDVLSELDRDRQNYLLGSLSDMQTMITCTGLDEFVQNRFQADRIWHVVNGGIA